MDGCSLTGLKLYEGFSRLVVELHAENSSTQPGGFKATISASNWNHECIIFCQSIKACATIFRDASYNTNEEDLVFFLCVKQKRATVITALTWFQSASASSRL